MKPKKGIETGSNFAPEMGPRIGAVPHVSRGRGPVSGIVLGPNFGPQDFWYFAPPFARKSGPFLVGRLNVRGFSWQGRSTAAPKDASVIL